MQAFTPANTPASPSGFPEAMARLQALQVANANAGIPASEPKPIKKPDAKS
jgi:hypothetical protein